MLDAQMVLLAEIDADAEQDMLNGSPITGAHHRAIEKHLTRLKAEMAEQQA